MIQIQFDQADLNRILRATVKLQTKAKAWGKDIMQRKCATDYFQLVAKNIWTQKYKFTKYTKRYGEWKARKFKLPPEKTYWVLYGSLVRNLQPFKHGEGWVGGIPPGIKGVKGTGDIAVYGAKAEEKRPLFENTMNEYAKDKNGWAKRGEEALNHIKTAWS